VLALDLNGQKNLSEDGMDKTTLLNMIQTEYAQFESLIAPLSEAQLCLMGQYIPDILQEKRSFQKKSHK
jgi:hypothetical protein